MSDHSSSRPAGGTEHSWFKAVPGGTGIAVLALLLSKKPDLKILETALNKLQLMHPIFRSTLRPDPITKSFSFITPPSPHVILSHSETNSDLSFNSVLEQDLNNNSWKSHAEGEQKLFFTTLYELSDGNWVLVFRLHVVVCDRTSAATLLRELLKIVANETEMELNEKNHDGKGTNMESEVKNGVSVEIENQGKGTDFQLNGNDGLSLGIEEYVPLGKRNKAFWARGVDMLGYSLNSLRLANLDFVDTLSERRSQVVRLQIGLEGTNLILSGCKSRGVGLCGALAAAGLIAARLSKSLPDEQWEKYAVVTLIDCRSILEPVLTSQHLGFYHSAILNTHDIRGGEKLWELAERTYGAFSNAKSNNKHFSDMSDLNFLMCKAVDNPGLTPSSSMRTSFISVFEDPMIDHTNEIHQKLGVKDYIGCASTHGVGPSIAIFDTMRDGELDCACVYPSPLHSREQMEKLVSDMKRVLIDACSFVEDGSQ